MRPAELAEADAEGGSEKEDEEFDGVAADDEAPERDEDSQLPEEETS